MIHFVDFEASSLLAGGYPVEVAWVDANGQGESYLIRPSHRWLESGFWSTESEALHGIDLDTLLKDGTSLERVAARVIEVLSPRQVMAFSDAPGFDGHWMDTLLEQGGQSGTVRLLDVTQAYGWACRPLLDVLVMLDGVECERAEQRIRREAGEIVARAQEADAMRPRVQHRALADAESLWRTWRAIGDEARRLSGRDGGVS